MTSVNVAAAKLEQLEERLQAAEASHKQLLNQIKSELGTAQAELSKAQEEYKQARGRLLELVPELAQGE